MMILVFGLELVVDSGFRDTERIGDHLQRRSADAVIGEQVQRGDRDSGLGGATRDGAELPDPGGVTQSE
jgi:hypothetical protein